MTLSKMQLHDKQQKVVRSEARYKIVRAGRRSGKTVLKIETLLFKATSKKNRVVFYIAPNQIQARDIIWEALKSRIGNIGIPSEQRLEMSVPTTEGGKSIIKLAGWENRENFRGKFAHHIEFDEVDTMKDFFVGWKEIFRPALIDTQGTVSFGGTPKKENPNLRRLEKEAENNKEYEDDKVSYRQEILAEYVDNAGALFKYTALIDLFTNSVSKDNQKYLTVDIADDGGDKTVFTYWNSLEAYRIEEYNLQTDGIINQIRESAAKELIPYSHIAVDAIGIGAGVASSPFLTGIIGYKSSYSAIRTETDIVRLPNVHYTKDTPLTSEYRNLRSQCVFKLAQFVNDHKISVKIDDQRIKSCIIEELSNYQDASKGDGKRMATEKEDVKVNIGRSPDISDTLIMRMYFVIREKLIPENEKDNSESINNMINRGRIMRPANSNR